MSGAPDLKAGGRVSDPTATKRTLLLYPACLACGASASNGHHVLAIGRGQTGDDLVANIISLCGSGSFGCHGAFHGNPYVVNGERRDAEWVARRIGEKLDAQRPDVTSYVLGKLGPSAGKDFLRRRYYYDLEAA